MAAEQGQYKARSRAERHHVAEKEKQQTKEVKPKAELKTYQLTLLLMVIAVIALFVGSLIGYGVIGGGSPLQVLNPVTWIHIYQLIFS
ncbi:DNA-directed RNA polymerase subunit beta [Tepidibacillus marianensis]|uniref:DNA-directed RNA polymerase subunit beta n=1 Tax=Tepidibacillus marianensis TaxID=3131995 RepID=UPI0030D325FA